MILEAGALVLADKGVCCIDEIDKMRPEDRVSIHEAMATQTISIAKGGIVATLNARTSILAAANPALGRYDPYRQFIENVNLPITILSRFDLIFVLRDVPEIEQDKKVASHLITLHATGAPKVSPPIPPEILKKYIAYAKRIEPTLSEEALKVLEDFYLKMRESYEETSTVTITARQLESLIRLTEARARVSLRKIATAEDAGAVVLLMKRSLSEVGIDVETGKMDIDVLMTGKPKSIRDKIIIVIDKIKEIEEKEGIVEEDILKDELKKEGLNDIEISKILNQLITDGRIYSPKPRMYKMA
jgi:replicative DNA helicase Mcm